MDEKQLIHYAHAAGIDAPIQAHHIDGQILTLYPQGYPEPVQIQLDTESQAAGNSIPDDTAATTTPGVPVGARQSPTQPPVEPRSRRAPAKPKK